MRQTNFLPKTQFGEGFRPVVENEFTIGADTDPLSNLEIIISNMIGIITVGAGIFFIAYFLIAAFSIVTAGGDSGKLTKAKDQMMHGVLGLIIVVISYAVIGLIGSIVGLNILNPREQLLLLVPGGSSP
jgi:uncharacterized membrane protein